MSYWKTIEYLGRYERDGRRDDFQLHFNKHETEKLLEYMGEAVPGFEYKWPNQNA